MSQYKNARSKHFTLRQKSSYREGLKSRSRRLVELSHPRAKVLVAVQRLEGTSVVLTSYVANCVAPPLEFGAFKLKGEEDDDACNGNAAGPSC